MISNDIKAFVLQALLKRGAPFSEQTLMLSIRTAFSGVALTDGDLKQWIGKLQDAKLVAGTNDDLLGTVWDLTPKGKIRAQQLL